jgi:hypothetical protein
MDECASCVEESEVLSAIKFAPLLSEAVNLIFSATSTALFSNTCRGNYPSRPMVRIFNSTESC